MISLRIYKPTRFLCLAGLFVFFVGFRVWAKSPQEEALALVVPPQLNLSSPEGGDITALLLGSQAERILYLKTEIARTADHYLRAEALLRLARLMQSPAKRKAAADAAIDFLKQMENDQALDIKGRLLLAEAWHLLGGPSMARDLLVRIYLENPPKLYLIFPQLIDIGDPHHVDDNIHMDTWHKTGLGEFRRLAVAPEVAQDAVFWHAYAEFLIKWTAYTHARSRMAHQLAGQTPLSIEILRLGSLPEIIPLLEAACDLVPDNMEWQAKLIRLRLGLLDAAGRTDLFKNNPPEDDPSDTTILKKAKETWMRLQKTKEKDLSACLLRVDGFISASRKTSDDYQKHLIASSMMKGDFHKMTKQAEAFVTNSPLNPDAAKALFAVYARNQDLDDKSFWKTKGHRLREVYETLVAHTPSSEGLLVLANIQHRTGHEKAAVTTVEKAARLFPGDWRTWHTAGALALKKHKWKAATSALSKAARLQTGSRSVKAQIFAQLALAHLKEKDLQAAVRAAQHAHMLAPDLPIVKKLHMAIADFQTPVQKVSFPWQSLGQMVLDERADLPATEGILFVASQWRTTDHADDLSFVRVYLDLMVEELTHRLKSIQDPDDRIEVLAHYIFRELEMSYELDVARPDSHFLPQVLATGTGNCIGLSSLYLVLAEKLDLPIQPMCLPSHAFVRYTDGQIFRNIETGDQGKCRTDADYIKTLKPPARLVINDKLQPVTLRAFLARLMNNLGALYMLEGRRQKAIETYQWAILLDQEAVEVYCNLGNSWLFDYEGKKNKVRMGFGDQESYTLVPVITFDMDDPEGAIDRQHLSSAVSAYEEALKHDPDYVSAYARLGLIHMFQERFDNARQLFSRAVQGDERFVSNLLVLASKHRNRGEWKKAAAVYKEVLAIKPNHLMTLWQMGISLANTGAYEQAHVVLTQAVQLLPCHSKILETFAQLVLKTGRSSELHTAIQLLERVDPEAAQLISPVP